MEKKEIDEKVLAVLHKTNVTQQHHKSSPYD